MAKSKQTVLNTLKGLKDPGNNIYGIGRAVRGKRLNNNQVRLQSLNVKIPQFTVVENKVTGEKKVIQQYNQDLYVQAATQNLLDQARWQLINYVLPNRKEGYKFQTFDQKIDRDGSHYIDVNKYSNDPEDKEIKHMQRAMWLQLKWSKSNKKINLDTDTDEIWEAARNNQNKQTSQLYNMYAPNTGFQQLQDIILDIRDDVMNDIYKKKDLSKITVDDLPDAQQIITEVLNRVNKLTSKQYRTNVREYGNKLKNSYIDYLINMFGVQQEVADSFKVNRRQFRGEKHVVYNPISRKNEVKYIYSDELRKLVLAIKNLTGYQFIEAINSQVGIQQSQLKKTVQNLLDSIEEEDVNFDDQDQEYNYMVVDGRGYETEKRKAVEQLFTAMRTHFQRFK